MQLLCTYRTQHLFEFRTDLSWLRLAGNDISAPNVKIVGQRQRNGLTGECLLKKTIVRHDSCDRGSRARRQHHDMVANTNRSGYHASHVTSKIGEAGRRRRSAHQLNRKAEVKLV